MALFGSGNRSQQPNRLGSVQVGTSEFGVALPIGWGNFKVPIKLLDYTDFSSVAQDSEAGGSGSGDITGYEYYAAVDMLLCKGPIRGVGNVFNSGGASTLLLAQETFTIGGAGHTTYQVAFGGTAFYYDEGVTRQVTYSVTANDYGSDGSVTLGGTQQVGLEKTPDPPGTPGALQYSVNNTGLYNFSAYDAGLTVTISYTYTTAETSDSVGFDARSPILRYALGLITGTETQLPWGYMLTNHPERALGYAGLARLVSENMDLGSDATTPNLSVEILNGRLMSFGNGVSDCDPSAIIADIATLCKWPYLAELSQYSNFCVANSLFMSPFNDSVRKATEIIGEICDLSNSAPVWSGPSLKIRPYGDTTAVGNGRTYTPDTQPVYEIDEAEMLCASGEEAVKLSQPDLADNYNRVQFEYTNRADNYNTDTIHEQDEASILMNGELPMETVTAHHYNVKLYAAIAMNMTLRRKSTPLRGFEFTLPWYYQLIEPMDVLALNLELAQLGETPVRIVSVEEQDDYSIKVEAEDFLFGMADGVRYPKGSADRALPGGHDLPGPTTVLGLFQPNLRVTAGVNQLWIALGGGASWGGCTVWLSKDGTNYKTIAKQYGKSRAGVTTATFASGSDPDTTNTLAVSVNGALASGTQADADVYATLCLVGGELISYETATLTGSSAGSNNYNLGTYLRRGIFSGNAQSHGAGEVFIRLDDSITKYTIDPALNGQTVHLKFTSFNLYGNEEQGLSDVTAIEIALTGGVTATNMVVGSFANSDGTTATVDVYAAGLTVGSSGQITLPNGATVTGPAQSYTTEALSTWYGVNYNPATSAYVLYTDASQWAADQATMIKIGSTTTPASSTSYLPTSCSDAGTALTTNPAGAYTPGQSSQVNAMGSTSPTASTTGIPFWGGFAGVLTADKTLSVTVSGVVTSTGTVTVSNVFIYEIAGAAYPTPLPSATFASETVTATIPAGTNLADLSVSIQAYVSADPSDPTAAATVALTVSNINLA